MGFEFGGCGCMWHSIPTNRHPQCYAATTPPISRLKRLSPHTPCAQCQPFHPRLPEHNTVRNTFVSLAQCPKDYPLMGYSRNPCAVRCVVHGYLAHKKTAPPQDPTVGLCLELYGGPGGGGVSLRARYPCTFDRPKSCAVRFVFSDTTGVP